jgi:hypothetical protein
MNAFLKCQFDTDLQSPEGTHYIWTLYCTMKKGITDFCKTKIDSRSKKLLDGYVQLHIAAGYVL